MKTNKIIAALLVCLVLNIGAIFFQRHFAFSGGENFALAMSIFFFDLAMIILIVETKLKS